MLFLTKSSYSLMDKDILALLFLTIKVKSFIIRKCIIILNLIMENDDFL